MGLYIGRHCGNGKQLKCCTGSDYANDNVVVVVIIVVAAATGG